MKSNEFLQAAIDVQEERGAQYDKPSGERSMGATVAAFNCITGNNLKEQDGWMLLGLLKLVRQSQNPEKYHHDSALDFVAYASLYAEAASGQCGQMDDKKEQSPDSISDMPTWPSWKTLDKKWNYCAQDSSGQWGLFSRRPVANKVLGYWVGSEPGTSYQPLFKSHNNNDWANTIKSRPQK